MTPHQPTEASTSFRFRGPLRTTHPCRGASLLKLTQAVQEFILSLFHGVEPSAVNEWHTASDADYSLRLEQRVLASFGQCANMPVVDFDLKKHSVKHWLIRYEAVMRCYVQPCTRGFVFLAWYGIDDNNETWGHGTALYLDGDRHIQVFVDPSCWCADLREGNMLELFEQTPLYDDASCTSTDMNILKFPEDIQHYFKSPESREEDARTGNLNGCCSTMVLLIVLVSLRFGSRDPQWVVDAIRCAMRDIRGRWSDPELLAFLRQLRRWHNSVGHPGMPHATFLKWIKVAVQSGSRFCYHMIYANGRFSGKLCPALCVDGSTWCAQHIKERPLPIRDLDPRWNPNTDEGLIIPPYVMTDAELHMAAYFDDEWQPPWQCSFDAMRRQLRRTPPEASLGIFDFVNFEQNTAKIQQILALLTLEDRHRLSRLTYMTFQAKEIDPLVVLRNVPLSKWKRAYIVTDEDVPYVYINTCKVADRSHLERLLPSNARTVCLRLHTAQHLEWLRPPVPAVLSTARLCLLLPTRLRVNDVEDIIVPFLRDRTTRHPHSASVQVPIQLNAGNRWCLLDCHTYCGRHATASLQLRRVDDPQHVSSLRTDDAWFNILRQNGLTMHSSLEWLTQLVELQEVDMAPWFKRFRG